MSEWMENFISQCMKDIPWGRYRRRAEAELRDHMRSLRQDLTEEEVLRVMGDPERLRREYYIAWKQTPLCRVNWIVTGGFVIWGLMCVSSGLATICLKYIMGLELDHHTEAPVQIVFLFLIPFSLGALFLRACFREERRRARWVTLGLLASWVLFNSYLVGMGFMIEAADRRPWQMGPPFTMADLLEKYPWIMPYLWCSFLGCLALGWLFGRRKAPLLKGAPGEAGWGIPTRGSPSL